MIWYRHWIEIRSGLWVAAIFMVLMSLFISVVVTGSTESLGPARFLPWAVHTEVSAAAALIVGIFVAGTGIRTNGFQPGHLSMYYTLTLPISRFELLWTRFASACAAVYVIFAGLLITDSGALLIMGQPVPFGRMALSSFLAGLLAVAVMAVFGVLVPLWNEKVSGLVYVMAIAAAFHWAWAPMLRFAGSPGIPWLWIGGILLITGAALSTAAILARHREF